MKICSRICAKSELSYDKKALWRILCDCLRGIVIFLVFFYCIVQYYVFLDSVTFYRRPLLGELHQNKCLCQSGKILTRSCFTQIVGTREKKYTCNLLLGISHLWPKGNWQNTGKSKFVVFRWGTHLDMSLFSYICLSVHQSICPSICLIIPSHNSATLQHIINVGTLVWNRMQ